MVNSAWPEAREQGLLRLGPLSVTRGSAGTLRLLIGAAAVLGLLLLGSLLVLWTRLKRAEATLARGGFSAPKGAVD
jgi:hypothetical protein